MKTEFNTASLKKAFALVEPATTRNSTLSILKSVRLRLASLAATDTIVQITAPIEGTGDAINVCVPVEKLQGILGVAGETITFEHKDGFCNVKTGKHRFKVAVHSGDDFPEMAETEPLAKMESTTEMHAAIARVMFAASKHDVRYYFNAVLIDCDKDALHVVACNGSSLATVALPAHHTPFSALLHRPVAEALAKWPPSKWSISVSQVIVETEDAKMVAKLVEGQYPQWRRLFPPKKPANSITLPRAELLHASMLSRLAFEGSKAVRGVKMQADGDTLKISSSGNTGDMIDTEIAVTASAGEKLDIAFNGDLLEPALRSMSTEDVEFRWDDPRGSFHIEDGDFRTIVMPLRI